MGEAAEELWHVRLSHDEIKQLSLEQLDDLFRLDVISADTQVWQPGMDEWLPLSVVAGLGDDEPATMSIPVSEPPPPTTVKRPMTTTQQGWPPPAAPVASWPPAATPAASWPPPASRAAAVTTRPPPPPSARSNAPVSSAMSSWPPAAAWSDPPARVAVSGLAPTIAAGSTPFSAPLGSSLGLFEDTAPRARRGGSGAWVVVLSVLVGVAVSLYRNDVVHAAANSMGQSATFLKLETALGGPGFGTPRAVEQMMTRPKVEAEPVTTSSLTTSTTTPAATTTASPTPAPQAEAPKPATPEPPKSAAVPEAPKAATPAVAAAPRAAAPAARSGSGSGVTDPDNVFKQPKKGKKVKGSDYDPLNPSL